MFDGSTIDTKIMRKTLKVPYARNHFAELVFLPYRDSKCEFVVILPRNNSEVDFRRALMAIDPSWFDSGSLSKVHLRLPKFSVHGGRLELEEIARELGLNEVFETEERIFPQPSCEPPIAMGKIRQQVVIELDEEGTRAVAFTLVEGELLFSAVIELPEVWVNVDRPFAYVIRNRGTGTILFMGTCLDPTSG
jgi:serpin B